MTRMVGIEAVENEQLQKCLIMGAFWSGACIPPDPRHMTNFSGEVDFNDKTRTLNGTMNDHYGISIVEENISETGRILKFKKTYIGFAFASLYLM